MRLEEFFEAHKDQLKVSSPLWGYPVPKSKRNKVRFLGTDDYVLIEIDKEVWILKNETLPAPAPIGVVDGIDVASYQPRDLTALIQEFQPEHVVVRMYLEGIEQPPVQHSIDQVASARAAGCSIGGYVWCYRSVTPQATILGALETAEEAGVQLPILWFDIEEYEGQPGPSISWIHSALNMCAQLGVRAGIYTAAWYWNKWHAGVTDFDDVPLWAAQYGPRPTSLDQFKPFGGWTKAAGIQWSSDPVDKDIFSSVFV